MVSLRGLESLESVGALEVSGNPVLSMLNLKALRTIRGGVTFRNNPALAKSTVFKLLDKLEIGGEIIVE